MLSNIIIVISTIIKIVISMSDMCPTVCVCKWKSGKRTVECTDRALITIPKEIDSETQVLDLSGNNLQILPDRTFHKIDLLNVQRLYLRNCRIGQIEKLAFKGLTNLIELDLSYNLLTQIPTDTFRSIPFLRDLILTRNPISKIDSNAFAILSNLVKLDLSNCQLNTISPQAFDGIESLELLKLSGNKLSELQPKTIEKFQRLHSIELHSNPWLCDCGLRGVKEWLLNNNMPFLIAPICRYGPDHVISKSFNELDIDDFACKPEMLPISRYIESNSGDNATIICRVGAVPSAYVKWYWNGRLLINNSVFSSHQKIFIDELGKFEKRSRLTLTNVQEIDSGDFYCVAENRAGSAEANFTLHVSLRMAGMASLTNGHIAGLSAALIMLIICIIFMVSILIMRLKKFPFHDTTKDPNRLEIVHNTNGKLSISPVESPLSPTGPFVTINDIDSTMKPFYSPSSGSVNPDLINDTRSDPLTLTQIPSTATTTTITTTNTTTTNTTTTSKQYYYGYPNDYGLPIVHNTVTATNMEFISPTSNLKTLRVWQKGGIPVLPPMSAAFKRALHQNRNSPDEGYQEGNTTDV